MEVSVINLIFHLLSSSFFSLCFSQELTIGSKISSDSLILAQMASIYLEEKYQVPVKRKMALGGTQFVHQALLNGDIDLYPEYSGTAYISLLKQDDQLHASQTYQFVKDHYLQHFNLYWSESLGFNNTYALTVRKNDERFKNITSISELFNKEKELIYAAPHEFLERKDGHHNLMKAYQLQFGEVIGMQAGLTYSSLKNKSVDIIVSYSTDGRIKAFKLKTLKDDLEFFPAYEVGFVSRKNPQENEAINQMFQDFEGLISQEQMMHLNDQVDRLGKDPKLVARNFLISQGLIKGDMKIAQSKKERSFSTYAWQKRNYILKLIKQHLLLCSYALILACLLAIPLGMMMAKNSKLASLLFPVVNAFQTIPSLAFLGLLIPILGIGFTPAVTVLFLYALLPLVRNTYAGLKAIDESHIEASKGMGLTSFQILKLVELPLALPIILSGVRTATIICIGSATLASLVGAGGLGDPIFRGIATVNGQLILLGALPAAILAILIDYLFEWIEKKCVSPGLNQNS